MLTKYRIKGRFKEAKIDVVDDVLRETKCFVVRLLNGRERRDGKRTEWDEYYDTWDAAHIALKATAEERLAVARRALELANAFAGDVKGMRPPTMPDILQKKGCAGKRPVTPNDRHERP